MSADAEQRVRTFLHPDVKGGARRLLEVIATQIPEGQTMTPEITIPELTALMGYGDNAARRGRRDLVKAGVLRIVDGGQGKVSRYVLMLLPNARGDDPALPLIGATPPPASRVRRPRPSTGPTLFDDVTEIRASDIVQNDRSWRSYFDHFVRSTRWAGSVLRTFCTMLRSNFVQKDRSSHQVLDVDGTRARAVPLLEEVLLPPAAADPPTRPPPDPNPSRCRWFPKTHAWCAGQRNHVPTPLDEHFRRNLGRLAHETDAEQRARAWAIYATEDAKIPADAQTLLNDFDHWRPILAAYLARAAPPRGSGNPRAAPSQDLQARAIEERRQRQGSGFS